MKMLIKAAKVIDPNSPHNGKIVDLLVNKGVIERIANSISDKTAKKITEKGLHVSPGWVDMHANFCDPGHEYKEDIGSGLKAAAAGGFTAVVVMPGTSPAIDSKADIEYLRGKASGNIVDLLPVGSLSEGRNGEELAEMYDMKQAGAIAFTDDKQPVKHAGLMERALLYSKNFQGLVISFPNDTDLTNEGKMHEGITSTSIGLKGMPALAEEIQITRDLYLAEYADSPIHFTGVSTVKSVDLIRKAKKSGIKVTAEVYAHHLVLDDTSLESFDTNLKVMPPLRSKKDIKALIKGIQDGTIDCISSDHTPEDVENKSVEFDHAAFGMIGLQTAYACVSTALQDAELTVKALATNARKILGLDSATIEIGNTASLTLFNPKTKWTLAESDIQSKSKNTPFIGYDFVGKVVGVINNGQFNY